MLNDALFTADGIVNRELMRFRARHGSTSCQIVTLLVLLSKVASSNLAIGMHVSIQSFFPFNLVLFNCFVPYHCRHSFIFKVLNIIAGGQ
jgi:hypothetical protein